MGCCGGKSEQQTQELPEKWGQNQVRDNSKPYNTNLQQSYNNLLLTEEVAQIEDKTIVFTGPKGSGKTSLIYYLKNKEVKKQCRPTQSIEQYQFKFNDQNYDIKDIPVFQKDFSTDA